MAYPKIKPCPKCGSAEYMEVYTYDSGTRRVECNNGFNMPGVPFCGYTGTCEGSLLKAIRSHNTAMNAPEIQPLTSTDQRNKEKDV